MKLQKLPFISSRPYQHNEDFWRVRNLLIATYPITPTGFNWEIRRWDGWNTHRTPDELSDLGNRVRLWETEASELVGAAHPEGAGDVFLEIHPDYREIEPEMLAWAEANLSVTLANTSLRQLEISVFDYDVARRRLVEARGYKPTAYGGVMRRQRLGNRALPTVALPAGYVLRTTTDDLRDCERMAALLNTSFRRNFHTREEYEHFIHHSPSFQHELNLVADAPDGSFASHVGMTYVAENRYGVIEPVCTHPEHERKGLARALIYESLQRIKALGATDAYVGTGDGMAANWLYEATGFNEVYHATVWRKQW